MHNSRLTFLQDRCNALERNLVQVTVERDTIKFIYVCLDFLWLTHTL